MSCCSSAPAPTPTVSGDLPVVVIGAGPVGLATAAHLLEQGLTPLVLERGPRAGHAIEQWQHIRLFSPWRFNIDDAAARLLESAGWERPRPTALPYGHELLEQYLRPLAELPQIAERTGYGVRVTAVTRQGMDETRTAERAEAAFLVRLEDTEGTESEILASAVIDASGTWHHRNPLGTSGVPALGEKSCAEVITQSLPDVLGRERNSLENKRVVVVGAGHSAANTLILLDDLRKQAPETQIHWVLRRDSAERVYGGEDLDGLPARGQLGTRLRHLVEDGKVTVHTSFHIESISREGASTVVLTAQDGQSLEADVVVPATGFRPDLEMLRELRLSLDTAVEAPVAIGPLIDPEFHSCGTVKPHGERELRHPEPNFYIAGMKSYGRAPTFLMATGYEQVRSIAAHLAGDDAAATTVHLELPETGVCSSTPGTTC